MKRKTLVLAVPVPLASVLLLLALRDGGDWTQWPWRSIPKCPLARRVGCCAVWTGQELIIWGGHRDETYYSDGARYDPAARTWTRIRGSPLRERAYHSSVWTGDRMIVWGGSHGDAPGAFLSDGAAYDPVRDQWTTVSASPLVGRGSHKAIWVGEQMFIWGGWRRRGGVIGFFASQKFFNDGALFPLLRR